ncbi:MAG TPA: Spy/CpxP family protein refolding chaperone [Gemmatimonadaceae bacterium]|nr:Spy/CpxP family protein refolding chaperone [Gemmatimonadaceae bacterium]
MLRVAFGLVLLASAVRAQAPDTTALKQPMDPENPTPFIILHRSELKLADSQVTSLQSIGAQLSMHVRPLKDSLDDLRSAAPPPRAPNSPGVPPVPMTAEQRDNLLASRRATARLLGEVHDAGRTAREQAIAVLNPDQQKKLKNLQDQLAFESRMPGRPLVNERGGPPGAASGAGTRPY